MARIASVRTLRASRRTRLAYAYRAIERAWLDHEEGADKALDTLGTMSKEEALEWAYREVDYMEMHSRRA